MVMLMTGLKSFAQDTLNTQRTYDEFFLEAMIQRQKGNNDAAFDLLRHCQELNPEAPEVYYYLAQYYNALKDTKKSVECIKKAAALQPDNDTYMETLRSR